MNADIFVQIPAYRDAELAPTLRDLYARASSPERLRTCVVWQRSESDAELPADVLALPNLEILEFDAAESRGCNWAREIARSHWRGEHYTLMLDSHHRFVDDWDGQAIAMLEHLLTEHDKPLLTAYLPEYRPEREPDGRGTEPRRIFASGREQGVLVRLTSHVIEGWQSLTAPTPADFLSLHFVFALGAFNVEVPLDPELYFFGDEVVFGLRAFTLGYEMFHPHRVLGWHAYSRAQRTPHWDDHPEWGGQHRDTLDWIKQLAKGDIGRLPAQRRELADYEARIMLPLVLT